MTAMTQRHWLTNFVFRLSVVLLPIPASNYKILLMPQIAKSHIFSMARIAESLAVRGHQVTFLVGEHVPLNLPELSNVSVVRYTDTSPDGVLMNSNAIGESGAKSSIEGHGDIMHVLAGYSQMYV